MSRRFFLRRYLPVAIAIIFSLMAAAILSFPTEFSFEDTPVSSLGDYRKNPAPGYFFYGAMVFAIGGLVIPVALFLDKRLASFRRHPVRLATLLTLIGATLWCVSVVFPNVEDLQITSFLTAKMVHKKSATAGFYSIAFAGFAYIAAFILEAFRQRRRSGLLSLGGVLLFALFMYGSMIGLLVSDAFNDAHGIKWPGTGLSSWTLWEWLMFVSIVVWYSALTAFAPEEPVASMARTVASPRAPKRD